MAVEMDILAGPTTQHPEKMSFASNGQVDAEGFNTDPRMLNDGKQDKASSRNNDIPVNDFLAGTTAPLSRAEAGLNCIPEH